MDLNKVYIILDHPDECRNIGAACRAMANNDITHLRIVGNKDDYDIEVAYLESETTKVMAASTNKNAKKIAL